MQGTRFAIRMVAVAVAAALAQGVAAADYEDETYSSSSDDSFDSFKVTDSDQTGYCAVGIGGSLTVNQAFSVSTERKSDANVPLLGVYVAANSTLDAKGGADISVINSSNLEASNNYVTGLQTYDTITWGGVI